MPRKMRMPPSIVPWTAPAGALTTGPVPAPFAAWEIMMAAAARVIHRRMSFCPCGLRFGLQPPREEKEEKDRYQVEWRQRVERDLQRMLITLACEIVACRADIGWPKAKPDEVHDK